MAQIGCMKEGKIEATNTAIVDENGKQSEIQLVCRMQLSGLCAKTVQAKK